MHSGTPVTPVHLQRARDRESADSAHRLLLWCVNWTRVFQTRWKVRPNTHGTFTRSVHMHVHDTLFNRTVPGRQRNFINSGVDS